MASTSGEKALAFPVSSEIGDADDREPVEPPNLSRIKRYMRLVRTVKNQIFPKEMVLVFSSKFEIV